MDQTYFKKYLLIKSKYDYTYKGYNLKSLIPGYLGFVFSGETPIARDVFKEFYTCNHILDMTRVLNNECSTVVSYLISRNDYKDLAYSAHKLYKDSAVVNLSELPKEKISFLSFTFLKHFWFAFWLVFSRRLGKTLVEKLFFMALTIRLLNQIKKIEAIKVASQIERYVCFNSAYKEEALLTAYFNKRNVETITMQHGIFCDFKLNIPFDIINHENLTARKLLCWGQSTVDYMSKLGMEPSRFILEGNLKYKDIEIGEINQTFQRCLVLLGRGNYINTNNSLLRMLTRLNEQSGNSFVFYIKKHPFLMDDEHKEFANISKNMIFLGREHSVQEVLKSDLVDFSIAVNTTAYYESLALGKPCLRWTEEENEEFYGMDDKFESEKQFLEKISSLKKLSQEDISTQVKTIIQYIFNPKLKL